MSLVPPKKKAKTDGASVAKHSSARLAGLAAVVTGSGGGIGRSIALRLSAEGARLVIADINIVGGQETVAQVTAAGGIAIFQETNCMEEASIEACMAKCVSEYGGLHILVSVQMVYVLYSSRSSSSGSTRYG